MPDVFINYRVKDGDQVATIIQQELSRRFGDKAAFRASESIRPSQVWPRELMNAVRGSSVLLALVGPNWLDAPDAQDPQRRALDNEEDWVRKEILEAFECGLPVLPILIGRHTERLKTADLPQPLVRLAWVQSMRYDNHQASANLASIGDALAELVPGLAEAEAEPAPEGAGPGGVQNTSGDSNGPHTQSRDISGGVTNTVIHSSNGPLNTGNGTQNVNEQHGTGATFIAGDNQGGVRQNFGGTPRDTGEER